MISNFQISTSAPRTKKRATPIRCAQTCRAASGAIAESDSLSIRSPTPARISTSAKSIITSARRLSAAITPSAPTAVFERKAAERDTLLMRKRRTARVRNERAKLDLLCNLPSAKIFLPLFSFSSSPVQTTTSAFFTAIIASIPTSATTRKVRLAHLALRVNTKAEPSRSCFDLRIVFSQPDSTFRPQEASVASESLA
jgi:hypothetical protein